MSLRLLAAVLLATTAMSGIAQAQDPTPDQVLVQKKVKKSTAEAAPTAPVAAPSGPNSAPTSRDPRAAGGGLTASPTDFGTVFATGGNQVSAGGVTGQDLGGGNMIAEEVPKTRSTVTRDAIDKLPPTANPYQMIEKLPGANVSSTDASGLNGGNITMRGFNSDQIGMTIEGSPVNDSGNYSLYPAEYIDSENLGQVSIAQGTPDLDSPHIGATGGVMNLYMIDPSKTAGGLVSTTFGSHGQSRQFVRVESGQIGNFRGFLSYSHNFRNHWNGLGTDNRTHIDAKAVWDLDAGNHIRASVLYNEMVNSNYPNPTLSQWNDGSWRTIFHQTRTTATDSNYIGYKINPFKNLIVSLPSDFKITDDLTYDVVPYFWYGFGSGGGVATMNEDDGTATSSQGRLYYGTSRITGIDWNGDGKVTNGTKVLYYNPSTTRTYRPGLINKLTYQLGDHKIVAGYWFEIANHKQTKPYAALSSNGEITDAFLSDSSGALITTGTYAGQTLQARHWQTQTITNTFFVGDTWSMLNDQLKLDYGIKQTFATRDLDNYVPGATRHVQTNNAATLPQAGISYKLDREHQIFTSIGTSFRTTPNVALADQFSTSTGLYSNKSTASLDPERSVTAEIGHRFQGDLFATSLSIFGTHYKNRQITTSYLDETNTSYSVALNAGTVNSYGIDFEIGTRPLFGGFRPYVSGEYLKTRLEDNLATTGKVGSTTVNDYLATRGKELPRAPNFQGAIGLDYDNGSLFGNLAYKYVGPQYATFMNDEKIPGFGRVDASIGYRFGDITTSDKKIGLKKPEIALNLYNIVNTSNLTGVYGVQTNAKATTGINGSTIAASSPTYYTGEGFAAMITFKSAF